MLSAYRRSVTNADTTPRNTAIRFNFVDEHFWPFVAPPLVATDDSYSPNLSLAAAFDWQRSPRSIWAKLCGQIIASTTSSPRRKFRVHLTAAPESRRCLSN